MVTYWHVQVEQDNPFSNQGSWFVCEKPFSLAEILSKATPGKKVWVSAYARCRCVYLDGVRTSDTPRLDYYYTGIKPDRQWAWEQGHQLADE